MKRIIPMLLLFVIGAALCTAQLQFTYPYVLTVTPIITCSPSGCNSYLQIGPGGYGAVYVFAQGSCSSGIRPYVTPQQVAVNCSYTQTLLYAYAFPSPSPNTYRFSFGTINAQQLEGHNGTYGLIAGNWVNIYSGVQWSDCYTGALRSFEPPPHPC